MSLSHFHAHIQRTTHDLICLPLITFLAPAQKRAKENGAGRTGGTKVCVDDRSVLLNDKAIPSKKNLLCFEIHRKWHLTQGKLFLVALSSIKTHHIEQTWILCSA